MSFLNVDSDSPLVRHWGEHRRPPRRRLPAWAWSLLAVSMVAALGLAVWLLHGSQPWRPPSGAPHFVSCTYGGYLDGWCARLPVASDPRRAARRDDFAANRRVAGVEATGSRSAVLSRRRPWWCGDRVRDTRECLLCAGRARPRSRHGRPARHGRLGPSCLPGLVRPGRGCEGGDRLPAPVFCPARRRSTPVHDEPGRTRPGDSAAPARVSEDRSLRGSYGATLAQAYVRRYPQSVRSLVLDSGSLPDVRIYRRLRRQRRTRSPGGTGPLRGRARLATATTLTRGDS